MATYQVHLFHAYQDKPMSGGITTTVTVQANSENEAIEKAKNERKRDKKFLGKIQIRSVNKLK